MSPGAVLSGRWQIQDFIGRGDSGEVYGVRDMHGTGSFALKLFWPNALGQAEIWSAVQQTARSASCLGAEGIARAFDFGIDANAARPFCVSERVSWSSLADRVRQRGPLTPAEMSTAFAVLARALDAAHRAGIVHRDLKPENVFVAPDNAHWVRITDFGVALLRSASPPAPGWGGTMGWVGPDAADPNARSTPAMDVFSLALVTFFALSGGPLHRAARSVPIDAAALWQELGQALDSASLRARELGAALDPAFDPWFQRALGALPQARFSSVGEMAQAFDGIARTLIAPQSPSVVALPGIAAAIAQPLVFQPDSPSPGAPLAGPLLGSATLADMPRLYDTPSSAVPGMKKRTAAPLLIGGALLCFALSAIGVAALYQHRRREAADASAAASASAAALVKAEATTAASAATSAVSAASSAEAMQAAAATPTAAPPEPEPIKAVVEAKPADAARANPPPRPAPKAGVTIATNSAKPVAVTKPSPLPVPKKKCGSTFIPCK
jgi:serine/threonine protein kinase